MALLSKRSQQVDIDGLDIPDLHADPRLMVAEDLLTAFLIKQRELEHRRNVLVVEHSLRNATLESTRSQLQDVLRQYQASAPAAAQLPRDADAGSKAILDAMAIVRGEPVAPPVDHAGQLAALDRAIDALGQAVNEQTNTRDAILGDLTNENAKHLKADWDRMQLEYYRSGQELSRNTKRINDVRARLVAAGFRDTALLMTPRLSAPVVLGYETSWDSEISEWRRVLERMGILK